MTRPSLTPLDATWCRLLAAVGALHELAAAVRAAGSPRVRPGQHAIRRAAAAALATLERDRWEDRGVRLTLTSAPTVRVDGEVVVTGASRLVVRLARPAPQLRLAGVVSLDEARRRRERAA